MHFEAISDPLWELLKKLDSLQELKNAYLGGGTALALQLGHRKSDDLDFFTSERFDDLSFRKNIPSIDLDTFVIHQTPNHTEMMIQSIKVDLITERIPLKFPVVPIHDEMENIAMADKKDIGRMKLLSIGSRGSKKDFVDLYCLTREAISLESLLLMAMEEDRGIKYSRLLFLKGLIDFEEADQEGSLIMIWNVAWDEVKNSLIGEVRKIAKKIQNE